MQPNANIQRPAQRVRCNRMLGGASVIVSPFIRRVPEHTDDMSGERVLDLAVAGDRLRHSGPRIPVPVVPPAMADQDASEPLDRADQLDPLHGITSSSTLRIPGSSPLVKSR